MSFTLYECPANFPKRIPGLLAAEGLTVSPGGKRMPKISEGMNPFSYSISDGACRLDLIGSEEDGTLHFYVWDSSGSNPRDLAKPFHRRVITSLLREGAQVWHAPREPLKFREILVPVYTLLLVIAAIVFYLVQR